MKIALLLLLIGTTALALPETPVVRAEPDPLPPLEVVKPDAEAEALSMVPEISTGLAIGTAGILLMLRRRK